MKVNSTIDALMVQDPDIPDREAGKQEQEEYIQ